MAKGQQRSNREAKKPKKKAAPALPATRTVAANVKQAMFVPSRKS